MKTQKTNFGSVFIFLAAFGFSFGGFFIKYIPWSALSINGGRNIIALFVTLFYILCTHHKLKFNLPVFFTAVCSALTGCLFCMATKLTTAANAIVLQYTSPVFVIIICAVGLKQLPKKRDILTCIFVFLGILCFFMDTLGGGSTIGNILALITGLTYAIVFMANSIPKNDAISAFFIGQILSGLVGVPFLLSETDFSPLPLFSILALGVILGLGYTFISIGLKTTSPIAANLISTIEPLLNPVWVAVFYGEKLSFISLIGFFVVLCSILFYSISAKPKNI